MSPVLTGGDPSSALAWAFQGLPGWDAASGQCSLHIEQQSHRDRAQRWIVLFAATFWEAI